MFRRPNKKETIYLVVVILFYLTGLLYVYAQDLSFGGLFKYGLLQPKGVTGGEARLVDIETPLSWNIAQVLWFVFIKGVAVLVELFQYWIVGMFIAAALVVFVPWEKIKKRMGYGGWGANLAATTAGAVRGRIQRAIGRYSLRRFVRKGIYKGRESGCRGPDSGGRGPDWRGALLAGNILRRHFSGA